MVTESTHAGATGVSEQYVTLHAPGNTSTVPLVMQSVIPIVFPASTNSVVRSVTPIVLLASANSVMQSANPSMPPVIGANHELNHTLLLPLTQPPLPLHTQLQSSKLPPKQLPLCSRLHIRPIFHNEMYLQGLPAMSSFPRHLCPGLRVMLWLGLNFGMCFDLR